MRRQKVCVEGEGGPKGNGRRFEVGTDEGLFEIVAGSVLVVIGMVYHYDRSEHLEPGERIAAWVEHGGA